jgi:hypothetical protein
MIPSDVVMDIICFVLLSSGHYKGLNYQNAKVKCPFIRKGKERNEKMQGKGTVGFRTPILERRSKRMFLLNLKSLLVGYSSFFLSYNSPMAFPSWASVIIALGAAFVVAVGVERLCNRMTRNNFVPSGKHCFITGGSSGLGKSLGMQLAKAGADITIVARKKEELDKAVLDIMVRTIWKNGYR